MAAQEENSTSDDVSMLLKLKKFNKSQVVETYRKKYAVKRKAIGIWGCKDCTASAWHFKKSQGCGAAGTSNNFCNGKVIDAQHFAAAAVA
ncbi:hypothetical protein MKW98_009104 [Papaver atlanticum]|uniref:Uncharacterized protein n=1 Tax=Papaver atlanticum TaxID=357466 RepID=A0AAD4T823_9MAGN|nr:hypothetical protein MKW98_009104 [Papaver atlanticum]